MKKIAVITLLLVIGSVIYLQSQKTTAKATNQKTVGTEIGNIAPDLNLPGVDGTPIALSSLRGQIVLIDFWASWCRPCRMENPNVVEAYTRFKDKKFKNNAKGFTVYSVSLDRDKGAWTNAINQDRLTWKWHVSDLRMWQSQGAAIYGVRGIPTNFLIDQNGVIVAKELRGQALHAAIESMLK